ncbi:MAG: hypothetical protein ABEJ31_10245 [Haloarculaceae archaeon]
MVDDSTFRPVSRREVLSRGSVAGVAVGGPSVGRLGSLGWGDGDGTADGGSADADDRQRPVIFVHGVAGSATQFESQAMRFSSNGYPDEYLATLEYNSLAYTGGLFSGGLLSYVLGGGEATPSAIRDRLDRKIDALRDATGFETVDAIGHSLGTDVMQSYLSDPQRASKVEHYVNLDGFESDAPPGGVPTLAVWGMSNPDASIAGAKNVHFDQSHVQVCTSAATFGVIYPFFTGEQPDTTSIVQEPADEITLSGRAQLFPSNESPDDISVDVYAVDPDTGERTTDGRPLGVGNDGRWGPIDVDGSVPHEFVLSRSNTQQKHHHYRQPEVRSDPFVRLLSANPGNGVDRFIDKSPDHAALIALRDKEWWGDQGTDNDRLEIDGTNVARPNLMPQGDRVIAPFVFDHCSDEKSHLDSPIFPFGPVPFLTGVDLYVPAADPPSDTIHLQSRPRDGGGTTRSFAIPNWASAIHRVSLYFPDHTHQRG